MGELIPMKRYTVAVYQQPEDVIKGQSRSELFHGRKLVVRDRDK